MSMLIYMFSLNGLTVVFYLFASLASGNGLSLLPAGDSVNFRIAEIAGYCVSFLLTIFLMSRGITKYPGFTPAKRPYSLLTLPVFFAAFFVLGYVGMFFSYLFENIGIHGIDASLNAPKSGLNLLLFIVQYTFLPALLEEYLFRGVMLGRLRRFGDGFAVVLSSFIFALMHHNIVSMPNIFLLGALFGYITLKSNSLIPSFIMHFLNNAIAIFATYIEQHNAPISIDSLSLILFFLGLLSGAAVIICLILRFAQRRRLRVESPAFYAQNNFIPKRNQLALGAALKSGWMITFFIIAVYLTLILEFLPRFMERFADIAGGFSL